MNKQMQESLKEYLENYHIEYDDCALDHIENGFKAGVKARDLQWCDVIIELRSIILSQPRYTDNNQMEVVELQSFKTAMNRLAGVDQMVRDMEVGK